MIKSQLLKILKGRHLIAIGNAHRLVIIHLWFMMLLMFVSFSTNAQKRPNIIVIISDDHAYQAIGAYGAKYGISPNIDKLAKQGVTFNNAFVTNSICGPSRAVLLTGKYSHKNGFKDNQSKFDASQDIFIKRLSAAGYQTAWIGKWHLETTPQGFDYWKILPGQGDYYNPDFLTMDGGRMKEHGYVTDIITNLSEDWLSHRDTSKPFCLVIGHKATHRVWIPDVNDLGMFDKTTFPLPSNFYDDYDNRYAAAHQDMNIANTMRLGYDLKVLPDTGFGKGRYTGMDSLQRAKFDAYYKPIEKDFQTKNLTGKALTEWKFQHYMRDYLTTAYSLDKNIGRVMDYLDQNNLTNNTLIIYTSDQGFYLGEHGWFDKRFMYEESFKTPLVMRYPGVVKPGSINNDLVANIDFAPTFLDAAHVPIPAEYRANRCYHCSKPRRKILRKGVYYHYYEYGEHSVIPHFGIRTVRYKLIRFYQVKDNWELFDLANDKHEMNNIYGKKGYEKITAELKKQLSDLIKQYDDKEAEAILEKE